MADRIVSIAPSATSILFELGADLNVVGVTNHCGIPQDNTNIERIGGWINPDFESIEALQPDIVLANDYLQNDVVNELRSRNYTVHHATPTTLDDVIDSFRQTGEIVGLPDQGEELATDCQKQLTAVKNAVSDKDRPVVYCEEWSNPPMAAGNWVPEAVRTAGGRYPFVNQGERSMKVDSDDVETADPDHVILHICGHGLNSNPEVVYQRGWDISADVHVIDDSILNQPSPQLFTGIQQLARIFHPNAFNEEQPKID